nr:EamA family transporter [Komagataeibacter sp. FNDCF1]
MIVWPVLHGHGGISGPHPVIVVLVLQLSAITWSLGTVLQRPLATRLAPEWTAAIQMGCASCLLALVIWSRGVGLPVAPSTTQLGAFAYLVIFGGVLAPASYVVVLRTFSPEIASTFAYVNPVVGLLLGWVVLGEQPAFQSIIGIVIVLGSVALIMRRT